MYSSKWGHLFKDCKHLEETKYKKLKHENRNLCPECAKKILSAIENDKTQFTSEQCGEFLLTASEFDNFEVIKVILIYISHTVVFIINYNDLH